jgi:hypothetical protein
MPAAHVLAAPLTMPAVNVELADDRPARNLGLELLIEMVLADRAAARGTLLGQGGVQRFLDLLGRRRRAMGVSAVLVALLAAGLFGVLLGRPLGERGRLPLGGAFRFVEALLEFAHRRFEAVDALGQLLILLAELLIFAEQLVVRRRVHAGLGRNQASQLSRIIVVCAVIGKGAAKQAPLNILGKYEGFLKIAKTGK